MRHWAISLTLALAIGIGPAAFAQPSQPSLRDIYVRGLTAYSEGDMDGFLLAMEEVAEIRPHQWSVRYNVAAGHALTGDTEGAVERLEAMADGGLYVNVVTESDFASLQDHPRYDALLAQMAALLEPSGDDTLVHEFDVVGLMPEGLAVDEATGAMYISSIREGRIWRVSPGGTLENFVRPDTHEGIGGLFGMAVDGARGVLWVTSSTPGQYIGPHAEAAPPSALFGFDLSTGDVRHYFPLDGDRHFLGEVVIGPDGGVYASDSLDPVIYRLSDDMNALEPYFAADQYTNLQGFDFAGDGRIYVADYIHGIGLADVAAGTLTPLMAADGTSLIGVDGLFYADGALIVIRNGVQPHRIMRLEMAEDGTSVTQSRVLVNRLLLWDEPTLGQIIDGHLIYNAASGWPSFLDDGTVVEGADLAPIRIMSVAID